MIQFDFIADKSCHRGTGILPVTESWPTYSNEQLTINNDRKNAPFALYKGEPADAALLYKNVACFDTRAKRYRWG